MDLIYAAFRHGSSTYRQGNQEIDLQEADDLAPGSAERVLQRAEMLFSKIDARSRVVIFASPTGRTLHTAKLIATAADAFGHVVTKINPQHDLGEVRGFEWNKFFPLVDGGNITVKYHGKERLFTVNPDATNPKKLGYLEYLATGGHLKIPGSVTISWPACYLRWLDDIETIDSVAKRANRVFHEMISVWGRDCNIVFVTHEAVLRDVVMRGTEGAQQSVLPGDFIVLGEEGGMFKSVPFEI
jgi:broad specificity phosphatase PhoE